VVGTVLDSPAAERLIRQTIESRLADQAVARLLDSEELWLLVEEIAQSPAVTDAITQQDSGSQTKSPAACGHAPVTRTPGWNAPREERYEGRRDEARRAECETCGSPRPRERARAHDRTAV
jgi:hypothetical protein